MKKNDIEKMYKKRRYQEIIDIYNTDVVNSEEMNLYAGFIFTELGLPQESLKCFAQINIEKVEQYRGKAYRYIGISNYLLGKYEVAMFAFQNGAEYNDIESGLWGRLLFPEMEDYRETEKINFRFVGQCSAIEKKIIIVRGLKTYARISELLGGIYIGKKIDIYVYSERYDSNGNLLSYADNGLKVIHVCIKDIIEHEVTHILFNSLHKNMKRNRFIDEGIAMFFSEIPDWDYYLENYRNRIVKYDVIELWGEFKKSDYRQNMEKYIFAGAFVGFLYKVFGKEKFIEFIKEESKEHAEEVFGFSILEIINEFYDAINEYLQEGNL